MFRKYFKDLRGALLERFNYFKFDIFATIGIPDTFTSSFKNGLSTRWILVIYPILPRTRVTSNKQVSSGASFECKKTSNYSTCKLQLEYT